MGWWYASIYRKSQRCLFIRCRRQALVDYVGSWGPMILGHAHPDIIQAVQEAAVDGLSFGAPTVHETTLADLICEIMPSIEIGPYDQLRY